MGAAVASPQAALEPEHALDRAGSDRGPARAQLLGLLAGPRPQPAGVDPVQPDVPQPGRHQQRQLDLLDRRLDPGHVQEGDQVPGGQLERPDDAVFLDPDPVVREQLGAVRAAPEAQRDDQGASRQRRSVVPGQPDLRLRPHAVIPPAPGVGVPPGGSGWRRRRRADVVRPVARPPRRGGRPARHVRRRRRHRGGEGRADRDRRLPQEPRQVPEARRPHPARRAAERPARHGQDPAGPGGGRRGRRAVLPDVGVGVRRDDRRGGRLARA